MISGEVIHQKPGQRRSYSDTNHTGWAGECLQSCQDEDDERWTVCTPWLPIMRSCYDVLSMVRGYLMKRAGTLSSVPPASSALPGTNTPTLFSFRASIGVSVQIAQSSTSTASTCCRTTSGYAY